jgi:hypothetical protein
MIAVRLLKDGAVVREALFKELPVTLGRDAGCDFPLFDRSVSRGHARIERDEAGALVLRDAGSRNGLHLGPLRVAVAPVDGVLRCLVGAVEVEIEPLPGDDTQEVRLHDWRRLERRRGPRDYLRLTALGVLGWLATTLVEPSFWSPWEKDRGVALLGHALAALISLPLCGALLLVLLKAFGRRLRLGDTLDALARLLWLPPLAEAVAYLADYPLPAAASGALRALLGVAVAAWTTATLAAVRRPGPSRLFRAGWALAAALAASGLGAYASLRSKRTGEPQLDFHVQVPLGGYAGRAESLDQYFARLDQVAAQAAAQAQGRHGKATE